MRQSEKILAAGIMAALLSGMYGAPVWAAEITGQKIEIKNGETESAIIEGDVTTTKMSGNTVTIQEGGASKSNVIAAWNEKEGSNTTADHNTVTINSDTTAVDRYVAGASVTGDATDNSVTINNVTVRGEVIGGQSKNGDAKRNSVTMKGDHSYAYYVYGGAVPYGSKVNAEENSVEISGGKVEYYVAGGSAFNGSANGNTITIKDAEVGGWVIGGTANGATNNNTVNISGDKTKIGSSGV